MNIIALVDNYARKIGALVPDWALLLATRVAVFMVFWPAAQTKLSGASVFGQKWMFWNLSDSTFMLFEYEYAIPLLPAPLAAYLATWAEFFLSIFILLGVFTRAAALGFLIMTLVIQVFVYPGAWASYLLWAVALFYLLKDGSGRLALENFKRA